MLVRYISVIHDKTKRTNVPDPKQTRHLLLSKAHSWGNQVSEDFLTQARTLLAENQEQDNGNAVCSYDCGYVGKKSSAILSVAADRKLTI